MIFDLASRRPDDLAVRYPEQNNSGDFDDPCEIPKPLTKTDGVVGCDHHFHADELGAAGTDECQRQKGAQTE